MNITKINNGNDLCGDNLFIIHGGDKEQDLDIITTSRINIDYAGEAIHFPWRFYIHDNQYVSVKRKL